MSWANRHIEKLRAGETVQFRPKGSSMSGRIESGNLVTVEPVTRADVVVGDIVLCKVKGQQYLHLVSAIRNGRLQISNARGFINGWTSTVYGRVTKVAA